MITSLQQLQNEFSHAARGHSSPDLSCFDEKRLAIYRELLLNNLHEVISPCFPVLLSILPEAYWQQILKNFLKDYSVLTPIFHELPKYMVSYLKEHPNSDYPFMAELAHYEWVELEVELCAKSEDPALNKRINLLEQPWQLASTARLLQYHYEVDKISPDYLPESMTNTYLIVYRIENQVEFLKINELSYQLLIIMFQESLSAKSVIHALCETNQQLNENELISASSYLISLLYDDQIICPAINQTKES